MIETPFGVMSVCDGHTHFFTRSFYENLGKAAGVGADAAAVADRLDWEAPPEDAAEVGKRWVVEMEVHGVERMVGIHTLPGDLDDAARGIAASGGRIVGYATINPTAPEALARTQLAITEFGFRGIALFPAMFRFSMVSDAVYALLDLANKHALNVFVHCGVLKVGFRTKLGMASAFDPTFSNPLSLQRPAAEFGRVKFIVPHFGSGMFRELLMVADQCPNIYTDTSGIGGWARYLPGQMTPAQVLRQAVDLMSARRIIFGSDSTFFPRGWMRYMFDQQVRACVDAELTPEQVRWILGENLEGILRPQ